MLICPAGIWIMKKAILMKAYHTHVSQELAVRAYQDVNICPLPPPLQWLLGKKEGKQRFAAQRLAVVDEFGIEKFT